MTADQLGLLLGAHSLCARQGCQYKQAITTLGQAQNLLDKARNSQKGQKKMSPARSLWCEYKDSPQSDGHPFNSRRGYVVNERTIYNGDGSERSQDELAFCIPHAQELGLAPKDDVEVKAIENGEEIGEETHS